MAGQRARTRPLTPLGCTIKKALIDKRMTQDELERAIGMPPNYLYLILRGYRSGKKYLPAIAAALGLDPDTIRDQIA